MKQSINLNPNKVIATDTYLVFSQIMKLTSIFLIGLGIASVFLTLTYYANKYHLYKVNSQYEVMEKEMAALSQKNVSLTTELKGKITVLKKELDENKNLSEVLNELKDYTRGFAVYLDALMDNKIKDLWLTHINVNTHKDILTLEGSALQDEAVPQLIKALKDDDFFTGKTFKKLKISKNEQRPEVLDFEIRGE